MFKNNLFAVALALLSLTGCGVNESNTIVNNQAIENIMTRTSVRSFSSQKIEDENIQLLLRAAMAAPTAMNKQPWHFVVVTAPAKLKSIEMYTSPLAIVVCGDTNKTLPGKAQDFWITDATLASQNIMLAAHALGLGSVWTAIYPDEQKAQKTKEVLGLPDNLLPLNTIILGYPSKEPQIKDKFKTENITIIAE